ncbi:hypothetical protein HY041_03870 [Candidatus Roizmanbacteria bacterium]|nr:hypothetical protein [Candidatus Roizmanbacteria bacterium]
MKEFIGVISVILAFIGYVPYSLNILRGKTKPHAFSWFIWFLLTLIGFSIQISYNAGPGAWMMGLTTVVCFLFFLAGLIKGKSNITVSDWFSLIGAFIAFIFWLVFKTAIFSVILIVLADFLGFYPTIRKSIIHPYQETLVTYLFSSLKSLLSLLALTSFSLETAFYLFYLLIVNFSFVLLLVIRRQVIKTYK